jgi:hypothetical protein
MPELAVEAATGHMRVRLLNPILSIPRVVTALQLPIQKSVMRHTGAPSASSPQKLG